VSVTCLTTLVVIVTCTGNVQHFTAQHQVLPILTTSNVLNDASHAAWLWLVRGMVLIEFTPRVLYVLQNSFTLTDLLLVYSAKTAFWHTSNVLDAAIAIAVPSVCDDE